jgi:hypothetical protein
MGRPLGEWPLKQQSRIWDVNVKLDLREIIRVGGIWNLPRIISNFELWYSIVEPSGSATEVLLKCLSEKHRRYTAGRFSILACVSCIITKHFIVFYLVLGIVCSSPCAKFYVL